METTGGDGVVTDNDLALMPLEQALTHSSFHKAEKGKHESKDNERMEFLGDAVLELCVSEELFLRFPGMKEGQMFEQAKAFVHRTVLPLLDMNPHQAAEKDYKTRLQEKIHQRTHGKQVQYLLLKEEGPDHKKTFTMAVELEGTVLGTGTGNSKQSAGQAAAKYALEQMGESI